MAALFECLRARGEIVCGMSRFSIVPPGNTDPLSVCNAATALVDLRSLVMETALLRVALIAPRRAFICELSLRCAQVVPLGGEASLHVQIYKRQGGGGHHDLSTHTWTARRSVSRPRSATRADCMMGKIGQVTWPPVNINPCGNAPASGPPGARRL